MNMTLGADLITQERVRQMNVEGYTDDGDALYENLELLRAAVAYCRAAEFAAGMQELVASGEINTVERVMPLLQELRWPWPAEAWKPSTDPLHNLVKAGALIAAEIDRVINNPYYDL